MRSQIRTGTHKPSRKEFHCIFEAYLGFHLLVVGAAAQFEIRRLGLFSSFCLILRNDPRPVLLFYADIRDDSKDSAGQHARGCQESLHDLGQYTPGKHTQCPETR